jgi:hypothetical protein
MNERHFSDAQLATALRAFVPDGAPAGSASRLTARLRTTPQQRRLPFPLALASNVYPGASRWVLVAAALLLLALALAGAVAVGALRLWPPAPKPELSLEPPRDLQAYVVSAVEDAPIVRPVALTVVDHGRENASGEVVGEQRMERVYVDDSGSVRIERFASLDAASPVGYTIITDDRYVELAAQGNEQVWIDDERPIDSRGPVALETAAYFGNPEAGCDMMTLDPPDAWQYVGLEELLGRPVHHLRCNGDLWIDVETHLIVRSRGPLTADGRPADETIHTVEVTSLELAPQPAALFDTTRPGSLRTVTLDEQQTYQDLAAEARACAADPVCSAPTVPLVTPPPATGAPGAEDVNALVARARAARDDAPPLHLTVSHWRSHGGDAGQDHLDYDGPTRLRVDWGADPLTGAPGHTSIAASAEEVYESQRADDGTETWGRPIGRYADAPYVWLEDMLLAPPDCAGSYQYLGVDLIHAFTADHIACEDTEYWGDSEYWIDRATGLVVRRQSPDRFDIIDVREVLELSFGPSPDERFRPPAGVVLQTPPPPDPNVISTPPPQPAGD